MVVLGVKEMVQKNILITKNQINSLVRNKRNQLCKEIATKISISTKKLMEIMVVEIFSRFKVVLPKVNLMLNTALSITITTQ